MKPENWIYEGDRKHVHRRVLARDFDNFYVNARGTGDDGHVPVGDIAEAFRGGAEISALAVKHKVDPLAIEAAIRTCARARRSRP